MMESATHSGSRALRLLPITQMLFDLRIANIVDGGDRVKEKAYRPRRRAASLAPNAGGESTVHHGVGSSQPGSCRGKYNNLVKG
jgi:hypothetical protein